MKNKLAIFDMDGTLFDTRMANYKSYQKALKEYDYELDYDFFISECFSKHYKKFLSNMNNFSLEEIEDIHNNKMIYYKDYLEYIVENEELFNKLIELKNDHYIALVTTASKENTNDLLNFYNRRDLFDLILTHNDIEKTKPDPEGFNRAISYFNVLAKDTIIFEDSDLGVEAAKKTGASVFVVNNF